MELTTGPDVEFCVSYGRMGGIVRITGTTLPRQPTGNVNQAMTIVMRVEDAKDLTPGIIRTVNRLF